jgi:hypothetical protein
VKSLDLQQLRRYAPIGVVILIVALGWIVFVSPALGRSTRASRQVTSLRQQLEQVRASARGPAPEPVPGNPAAAFQRQVAAGDASSELLEQLASLASSAQAANLLIETGERVVITPPTGPQVANQAQPDPRLALFNVQLAYSPVTMSFDGDFENAGAMLWRLRDLATAVEIRSVEITPVGSDLRRVHVAMSLFAYARPRQNGGSAGAMQ